MPRTVPGILVQPSARPPAIIEAHEHLERVERRLVDPLHDAPHRYDRTRTLEHAREIGIALPALVTIEGSHLTPITARQDGIERAIELGVPEASLSGVRDAAREHLGESWTRFQAYVSG